MNVEVWPVRNKGALVGVKSKLHGKPIRIAFFADNASMRLVRIFGDHSLKGREVPVEVMRDAQQRAFDALADLEPQTDRITSFAFAADIGTAQAVQCGG